METKIGCVLMEQLQKDEVDGLEVNRARDEFIRIKQLYNLLNNLPLINVTNEENNQIDLKAPHVIFPNVNIDGFDWIEELSTKTNLESMEYSNQEQIYVDENAMHRTTDCYVLNEQLQKDEVDGLEVNRTRDEFIRIKQLYNLLNNEPLINVTNEENDQIDLKAPHVIFPNVNIDGFNWIEELSTKINFESMEYSNQEQIHVDENAMCRTTNCEYDSY
ncbi:unnamed protein product [Rotaria sordida]|uniref:Uncharacterized protein n=1 Tax=Rotaria sordida TaxID=392033 RepID=A0A815AZF2_9BILA|nr:unnamed protein product [Rotaria sordida]